MARGRAGRWPMVCGLLLAVALLGGCGEERPADIPRPAPGLLSWFEGGCPDLRGDYHFLVVPGGTRARYPGVYWDKQMQRVPRHHTVWSIESLDAGSMVIRTSASAGDMREGFMRWHDDNKYAYQKWLEKHAAGGTVTDPSSYPRSSVYTIPGEYYACERGWLVVRDPPPLPGTDARPLVRMTRAVDGGLVVETRGLVGNEMWLWCGPRCWKQVDLPDRKDNGVRFTFG